MMSCSRKVLVKMVPGRFIELHGDLLFTISCIVCIVQICSNETSRVD
jgi:hypothetical protein